MQSSEQKLCPHGSVGVVFERDGKYLIFRRLGTPQGWAGVAGHLDGDDPIVAARKEALEEVGVSVTLLELLLERETFTNNPCGRDGGSYDSHRWHVYRAAHWTGELRIGEPDKHADLRWVTKEELADLFANEPCDPVWPQIFAKLGILAK